MSNARALLSTLWTASRDRLRRRLDGITEEEFGWEPVAGCWALRPSPTAPGGFQIDYDWPTPIPPPFTTIAWRLVHLANGNRIRWEHAVGPARRNFLDLEVPGGAGDVLAYWRASCQPISDWLARQRTRSWPSRPGRCTARRSPSERRWWICSTSRSTTAPRSVCCVTCSPAVSSGPGAGAAGRRGS